MVCLVYVGKAFKMDQIQTGCPLQAGYDSHISPGGDEVVVFKPECILPCYKLRWVQSGARALKYQL